MYLFKCIELAVGVTNLPPLISQKRNILNMCSWDLLLKSPFFFLQRLLAFSLGNILMKHSSLCSPTPSPHMLYLCRWDILPQWNTVCTRVFAASEQLEDSALDIFLHPWHLSTVTTQKAPGLLDTSPALALWELQESSITLPWKYDGKWKSLYQERKYLKLILFHQES